MFKIKIIIKGVLKYLIDIIILMGYMSLGVFLMKFYSLAAGEDNYMGYFICLCVATAFIVKPGVRIILKLIKKEYH